jgi:ATP-dependent Lon protease
MIQKRFNNDSEVEFMPIIPINEADQEKENEKEYNKEVIILPLRNTVLFPGVLMPITIGRESSVQAVNECYKTDKLIGVLAQTNSDVEEPDIKDLQKVGTLAQIMKLLKMPDGGTTIIIQGKRRFEIEKITTIRPFFKADVNYIKDENVTLDASGEALVDSVKEQAAQLINANKNIPAEATLMLKNIENPIFLTHFVAGNLLSEAKDKQDILEVYPFMPRLERLSGILHKELQYAELKHKVSSKARTEIDKQQREYFLQQQLKSIKDELGGADNDKEVAELKKKGETKKWPAIAKEAFDNNIQKLERMHSSTPDYSVVYNYVDFMLRLPWDNVTTDNYNLKNAKKVLDKDHFGMTKIKERILEYLAVLKLKGDMKSPILCFVGPPGIGKTSLGRSIAAAIGRKYSRISFGGMHDESEIRGHRKTYIGAMPGRLLQNLIKCESSNPVMILDEIDKIGRDFKGDVSSALLEVLDPEQNSTFYDNYLELEYDLSRVLFIATANSLSQIQPALRDRLEIIDLSGYALEEKIEIAKQHLLPKQKEAHGLGNYKMNLSDKTLHYLAENYTRESGVRELERQLASVMRYQAKEIGLKGKAKATITNTDIEKILGKPRYSNELYKTVNQAGVAVGLAWTYVGGDILFIETSLSQGNGQLKLTGNLGQVMKESAETAYSFLQTHGPKLSITTEDFKNNNVHIHVPEGATPKDGPSAGITMLCSLASAYTKRRLKPYLAMTGEITLRGQVLPVGGIKEKILAAKRAGLKEIILCQQNEKDILEIENQYIKGLTFHYVKTMQQVLDIALS